MIEIKTDKAPKTVGPYSQGIQSGNFLFVSGQIPIHPETGEIFNGNIAEQTDLVIDHMQAVLKAGGADLSQVVRVDIFLTNLDKDFEVVNEVYCKRFASQVKPVRQTVEVSRLPKKVKVEMSCIAHMEEG